MAYITATELANFVSLNAVSDLPDSTESDRRTQAIDFAQGEVDGYLSAVVSTPIASPNSLVKLLTCKIAFRYVLAAFAYISQQERELAQQLYDEAIATLEKIAAGDLPIGDSSSVPVGSRWAHNGADLRKIQTITNPSGTGTANRYTFSQDEND